MNIFSYESKFSQTLIFVGDLCILNLLFIICCLPVFTIGAAQAALYTGIRTLLDKEAELSPTKAFFKSFKSGFGSVTGAWLIFFIVEFILVSVIYGMYRFGNGQANFPMWCAIIATCILMVIHAQIPLFHSRFSCSIGQLLRNSFLLLTAYPIRTVVTGALLWLPLFVCLWDMPFFMAATPGWALLYYAVAFLLNFMYMKKPFKVLIDHYNQTHDTEGNVILAKLDEEGNLVYENSIQDALDAEAAARAADDAYWADSTDEE